MAEINRKPSFWDPATGYSDDVVVKNTGNAVTVKRGMLLLSDGAGNYTIVTTASFTRGTSNRIAIALEDADIEKGTAEVPKTVTIKAVKSGVVSIESLREVAGYTVTTAADSVLDELGGISNIVFVHTKEVK